jgi:uracil-DNA glycosylase
MHMAWSERQVAMLDLMGVRVWQPQPPLPLQSFELEAAIDVAQKVSLSQVLSHSQDKAQSISVQPSIATMEWAALRGAVKNCTACTLCSHRQQTVFGIGHEQAHCMVVGEAPGEQEDLKGEPFVGKSGQLLDNMLRAVGLSRAPGGPHQQVYIANTVKCRPPSNRNPDAAELAQCSPYLLRQVALVRPRVIVAMGRFAVQSLLRSTEPLGRLRGRLHAFEGVPLVVTYHPAYLLRNPEDKARAWSDLCLARNVLEQHK